MSPQDGVAYEHVAFDLDGTLIDSRADLLGAVNHVLRTFALPEIDPVTLYGYVGDGARTLVARALGAERRELVEPALAEFMRYYGAHLLDATRPYAGIEPTLDALAARGVALSVLTNKPEGLSRTILAGLGLLPRFVGVVGGDSLPARKPDPSGMDHLRSLTGTPAGRALLVGDSAIDFHTARAAGVAFCGVAWGLSPEGLRAAAPEHIVEHPAEIVTLVDA